MTIEISLDQMSWNRSMKGAFDRGVEGGLKRAGLALASNARRFAPVDTGSLRSSITSQPVGRGMNMVVYVGPNVVSAGGAPYDVYQEFGTGIHALNPSSGGPAAGRHMIVPRRAKFLVFTPKGGSTVFAKSVQGVKPVQYMRRGLGRTKIAFEFAFGFTAVRR